ncbi:MAG: hypothetical protein ABIP79_13495 [Chitinophagaceae bacterium]
MVSKSSKRKFLKISAIISGIILLLLLGFHFWFKAHAKKMLEDLVESKSHGKLKMKVGKLKFGYFSRKMELDNVIFYNIDTLNVNTTYRFDVKKINLKIKSLIGIIFQERFLIDSISLQEPHIQVTRLKQNEKPDRIKSSDVSIPEEMGKIYRSIQDAINELKVSKFSIQNGKFTLNNKIQANQQPVIFSNLDFQIDNFSIDSTLKNNKEKILFSDNVILRSHDQDIELPDSRHRISFKNFRINLKRRLVEFDSCTIAATRTDSATSAFSVFFDKLLLTNIDFDTLYKAEVIKADSVYCVNPKFTLKVEIANKKGNGKSPPKLESIIKQLTGDLIIGHVVVSNADFNIETVKDGIPNTYTFSNNNFGMQGFSIDQGAKNPIKVDRFALAIRNYENFIKDSTYSIKFDSIIFKDDRITLSNFLFENLNNGKAINSFSIPQFYLGGLSWDDLIFERKLKADQATMFYPTIIYTVNPVKSKAGQQNIFQSLVVANAFMDLNFLEIIDGNIDLTIKKDLRLKLYRANLSIESNSLLSSKKIAGIKNSLTSISFEKGNLKAGSLNVELKDLRYIGYDGHFIASNISVSDKNKNQTFFIQDVEIDKMIVNELNGNIEAEGISWKKGTVNFGIAKSNKGSTQSFILLKNVSGKNTDINISKGGLKILSAVDEISFDKLESQPGKTFVLEGLNVFGKDLKAKSNTTMLSVANYHVSDNKISTFKQTAFRSNTEKNEIDFSTSYLQLVPHIRQLLDGEIILDNVIIEKPIIKAHLGSSEGTEKKDLPKIIVSSLKMNQPRIDFSVNNNSKTIFKWNGSSNPSAFLEIKEIKSTQATINKTTIGESRFHLSNFEFSSNGKKFFSNNGNIVTTLKNIELNSSAGQPMQWKGFLESFTAKNFLADSVGKYGGNLIVNSTEINNLNINSLTLTDFKKIIAANKNFKIRNFTGAYKDSLSIIKWTNAGFSRAGNDFSLDSFFFSPGLTIDSFLAQQDFQKDYITFKTGAVSVQNLDPDLYLKENTVKATSIKIKNATLTDYKDKQIPFNSGLIKPMPVEMLKNISFKVDIENAEIENGNIEYTETSAKTDSIGVIPITRVNIRLKNIKNYNFLATDSLQIDATGFLLDTALLQLNIRESYNDPNGGFLLTFQLSPMDLTLFNTILIPLSSAKLKSGRMDSLSVVVQGREAMAFGEMKLFYQDLKIQFLKNGKPQKFKSFLANTFIKKNNTSRIGQIFFVRLRDRSAINYYIKIIGSGAMSSLGVKNNKKQLRKYKKKNPELIKSE